MLFYAAFFKLHRYHKILFPDSETSMQEALLLNTAFFLLLFFLSYSKLPRIAEIFNTFLRFFSLNLSYLFYQTFFQ